MANKTIGQLTELTPNSSTELAIFSNNTTGKATVSALLNTENFTSEDTSLTPSSTASVDLLQGTDSWSQRFVKVSQMFKNIRWILSKLGSTDISTIGDGTLTGAISTLETDLIKKEPLTIVPASSNHTINKGWAFRIANIAIVSLQMISTAQITAGQTGLFRLDYAANHSISPDIANNGSQSGTTVTIPLYLLYGVNASVTGAISSGNHIYITSQSTIPANTTIYVSGCFACHNQN